MNHPRSNSLLSYLPLLLPLLICGARVSAQEAVTIFFDNSGDETDITTPGTTEFSFMGSSWSGGVVATERVPPLYASGLFSYEVTGDGLVSFDDPVDSVEFFYVHGSGFSAGTATAFDREGAELGSVESKMASTFADPNNFVALDPDAPISRLEFSAGVIDNFSYTPAGGAEGGLQLPGDCTQNGTLDISDAICLLGVLFIGDPPRLPCGDGTSQDPGNIGLQDWGGDGLVNLTDAIGLLEFLFLGGPPHTLAVPGAASTSCRPIAGCTDSNGCD